MRKIVLTILLLNLYLCVSARTPDTTATELKVFLDCNAWCDMDFIKTEITFVDFAPDRFTSNVYVMITSQSTGSGGQELKMYFSGQERFRGMADTLTFYRNATDTDDEYRKRMVHYLKLGLTPYISKTALASRITISVASDSKGESLNALTNKKDKWNFWVFNISTSGNINSDDFSKNYRFGANLNGSRVTEKNKFNFNINASKNERKIIFEGEETVFNYDRDNADITYVKSITSHWSAGGFTSATKSIFSNHDLQFSLQPAFEYSYFPYKESVKKSITLFYQIGPVYNNYIDTSYYNKTSEWNVKHNLSLNVGFTQKWGNINANLSWENFLNSFTLENKSIKGKDINTLSVGGFMEYRVVKGLTIFVSSFANFTKGVYPNIERKYFTRDDLLTNAQQYPTQKALYMSFGINYRFGSIYNNVVNPRFSNAGGSFFF
ncbi:MAG TPA: hypothetical protein VM012_03380 [Flavitalea sp.]|nr:hypothetical protein [Flavitalea sp.]